MKEYEVVKLIDHTNLKPTATVEDITNLCNEAKRYGFAAVCVNPYYVELASRLLAGSGVKVCSVVGFPLGATLKNVKAAEARHVLERGASEVDMVMNISAFKSRRYGDVRADIEAVVEVCKSFNAFCKVIIECCYLDDDEKRKAAELAVDAGADFVKTSTGLGPGGATVEDVKLLKQTIGERAYVKASGGIRTLKDLLAMVKAGADRIGTSSGAKIAEELRSGDERKKEVGF